MTAPDDELLDGMTLDAFALTEYVTPKPMDTSERWDR